VFFAEREMYSDFSLIEVDIREGSGGGDSRIESHTELTDHHFSLELHYVVIEFLEFGREVVARKHSSTLDHELKGSTVLDREVLPRE
jgi:hypothetical protein